MSVKSLQLTCCTVTSYFNAPHVSLQIVAVVSAGGFSRRFCESVARIFNRINFITPGVTRMTSELGFCLDSQFITPADCQVTWQYITSWHIS